MVEAALRDFVAKCGLPEETENLAEAFVSMADLATDRQNLMGRASGPDLSHPPRGTRRYPDPRGRRP